jgi:hypothetical protein
MTDKAHLKEFGNGVSDALPTMLVATHIECYLNPPLSTADVVTRLKEMMEQAMIEDADASA